MCGPSDLAAFVFCLQGYTCLGHDFIQTGAISNGSITSVIVSPTLQQRLGRRGFDKINVRALSGISLWPSQTRWEHVPWEVLRVDDESEEGEEWSESEKERVRERERHWAVKWSPKDQTRTQTRNEQVLEEKLSKNGKKPFFSPRARPSIKTTQFTVSRWHLFVTLASSIKIW